MVRVKLLQQMSGTRNGVPWPEWGETMEVTAEEAASLCSGQTPIAELVETEAEEAANSPVDAQVQEGEGVPANASAAGTSKPKTPAAKPAGTARTRPAGSAK